MNRYTFNFSGQIIIDADNEEEARELADDLLGLTPYPADNSVDCSIYEIDLIDVEEV